MANVNAPFGFRQYRGMGSVPTFEQSIRKIAAADSTAVYFGDPVSNLATGYVTRATAGTNQITGIFMGCKYLSISQKRTVWGNYWPGSDANGDVEAYICDDPNAQFIVQTDATGIFFTDIGSYCQFNLGTGNANTGISGAYVGGVAVTVTLPFRVIGMVTDPPGQNGTDVTTPYNQIIVAFNNVTSRNNGVGPTGI